MRLGVSTTRTEFPGLNCSPCAPGLRCARDTEAERLALEELVECDPGAMAAMESLAELLLRTGRPERAKQLRACKGELERTLDWYVANIFPADRLEHATELARAAEAVGRRFEAHCWWELAAEQPSHTALARAELARLDREEMSAGPSPRPLTPAGLLAELNAGDTKKPHARRRILRPKSLVRRRRGVGWPSFFVRQRTGDPPPDTRDDERRGSACSTTTATAGSTSTLCREANSPRVQARTPVIAFSGTGATARSRMSASDRESPRCHGDMATVSLSATSITTATPICS